MTSTKWFKSPEVLVLENPCGTLKLIHQVSGLQYTFQEKDAVAGWTKWEDGLLKNDAIFQALKNGGFVFQQKVDNFLPKQDDLSVPLISDNYIKWYQESSDNFILFNTKQMSQNNPLLALGPYGSLCWRLIVEGSTISVIRNEALRVFGCDEVNLFLQRLIKLGFIAPISMQETEKINPEKIIKEFSAPNVQFQLHHAQLPWYCLWEICSMCNLRCKTCYLSHFSNERPELKKISQIADRIIEAGLFFVSIMGGEALLLSDLEFIVEKLRAAGIFVKLITNGHMLTQERAKSLTKVGLNMIEISLDGLTSKMHDYSRGSGTFLKAIEAIDNAFYADISRIGIVWTIHTGNFYELKLLPEFMRRVRINECYISLFKKTGLNGSTIKFDSISNMQINEVQHCIENWKDCYRDLEFAFSLKCSCGCTSLVIGENGNIRICPFKYVEIGNILDEPLRHIWGKTEIYTNRFCLIDDISTMI